ncbi:putative magnesium transporter NIPA9 [Citrus sinensis]|nr:putative magnesium transporter NIPA9 [Citrus sinensis]
MWELICLTLAATAGNNIGKVLQKKGTVILPPLSFKLKVIRAYAVNKAWVIGFLMDIFGALLMLRALSQAPVSVIQPVSGCGLAILSIFSHFYLKEVMNAVDWMGITLAGIGTIGVGAGGEEQEPSSISIFQLPWLAFVVSILFVLLNGWLRICKHQRREQEMTRGLKHGRAIVVSTCAAVASIVTGVVAGMLALGERLPSAPTARFSLLLGWLLIMIGVVLLVSSSRLVRHFRWPSRRIMKSGLVRTGSQRVKDSGPSAVIPAATLHQLITSTAKEKA